MRKLLVAVLVLFVVVAQRSTGAAQNAPGQPPVGDPVNGKAVFTFGNTSCTNCHGVDGVGGWGPDLAGKGITYQQAFRAIRNPIWRMPAFAPSQLTDQEIADIVAYWATLPPTQKLGDWKVPMVDAKAQPAQQLAVNTLGCGQCHGATLETPRHGAGEVNGDFEWFKAMVYQHSTTQPAQWKELDASAPMPVRRARVRMGNFIPRRLTDDTMKELWAWMNEMGILVPVQGRLTGAEPVNGATTYTLAVTNVAVPNKGLSAEDATIRLIVPAGMKVMTATGTGYKGVKHDGKANADVATWNVPKIAPRDQQTYTITMTGAATGGAVPKGDITWNKPRMTEDAYVMFQLQMPGGRGRGAAPAATQ
jgi:mono/diheme cytochrome c family protein